jgi:hypothetical protein
LSKIFFCSRICIKFFTFNFFTFFYCFIKFFFCYWNFFSSINRNCFSLFSKSAYKSWKPFWKFSISFTKWSYNIYKSVYDSGNWDALTEDEKSEFSEYTNKPKEADAQGVVTLDFYRNYLIGLGGNRWSAEQEAAYNKQVRLVLINKELATNPANAEELYKEKNNILENFGSALFPPLKLGHYGPIVEDPKLNGLHKFSLIPLIPSAIEGKQLEKQLELMYKNNINYYTVIQLCIKI